MQREYNPEYVSALINRLPEFTINPYGVLGMADAGRVIGLLRASAVVRLPCGSRVETQFRYLAAGDHGYYRRIPPRAHSIKCPRCGRTTDFEARELEAAIEEFDGMVLDCGATAGLLMAMLAYQRHGGEQRQETA